MDDSFISMLVDIMYQTQGVFGHEAYISAMRESWREYRRLLRTHGAQLAGGAILGLLGIALSIRPVALPAWVWFLLALASIAWLGFVVFHDVRVARDAALVRHPFPDMKIEAPSVASDVGQNEAGFYPMLALPLRITNRESTRVSLTIELLAELAKEDGEAYRLTPNEVALAARRTYLALRAGTFTRPSPTLRTPLHIDPETTTAVDLAFTWYEEEERRFADPPTDASPDAPRTPFNGWGDRLRLDVTDHISGQTISLYVPGFYETRGNQLSGPRRCA